MVNAATTSAEGARPPKRTKKRNEEDDKNAKKSKTDTALVESTNESLALTESECESSDWEIEELEDEATALHVIEIGNEAKLQIDIFYDSELISLDDIKIVKELDDVCFLFTRDTDHCEYDASLPTQFKVNFDGQELCLFDGNTSTARLRLGPFLSHHLGNQPVVNQGNLRPAQVPRYRMKVYVTTSDRDHYESVSRDIKGFTMECGSRGIRVPSARPQPIPTEVAALFSNYFYNIFYGSFKDSREKWVEMLMKTSKNRNVDEDIIIIILADTVFRSGRWIPSCDRSGINWDTYVEIFEHCDMYAFLQQSLYSQRVAEQFISSLDEVDDDLLRCLQEISTIIRKDDLLRTFAAKFFLPACIDDFEKTHSAELSPEFVAALAARKTQLPAIVAKRPIMRLHFERGDIVCSLLADVHPVLVKSVSSHINVVSYMSGDHPPGLNLDGRLKTDERQWRGIFEESTDQQQQQQHYYLMYFDLKRGPELNISDRQWSNGWLVGVVTAGSALIPGNRGAYSFLDIRIPP